MGPKKLTLQKFTLNFQYLSIFNIGYKKNIQVLLVGRVSQNVFQNSVFIVWKKIIQEFIAKFFFQNQRFFKA